MSCHIEAESMLFSKRKHVNIEFRNLSYSVRSSGNSSKYILKQVNGKFLSNQFTAIIGPSGGGKTSLLNVLAGKEYNGITGDISINDEKYSLDGVKKISRYIMQDDHLNQFLTLDESMVTAANLKLNSNVSEEKKRFLINEILNQLQLDHSKNTLVRFLSGGEKRRLSIALELLNNPPILFLDEPTTGLDDSACFKCIELLKRLAEGGRTIISVLHTPSPRAFDLFDKVYVINEGKCVYHGYGQNIVPFLHNFGLVCPTSFSISDYMIEVCNRDYGDFQDAMVSLIKNGRETEFCKKDNYFIDTIQDDNTKLIDCDAQNSSPSFLNQMFVLIFRIWKQMIRNKKELFIKIIAYIFMGLAIGNIFLGAGGDASKTLANHRYLQSCIFVDLYVPMFVFILWFPQEFELLKRETFNQWYGLGVYFVSLTIANLPMIVCLNAIFASICYYLTDQPVELQRMIEFFAVGLFTSLVAEGLGLTIGSIFNATNGIFVALVIISPMVMLVSHGFGYTLNDTPLWIRILLKISFLRYSVEGLQCVLFKDRLSAPCPEEADFCIWMDNVKVMRGMGFNENHLWLDLTILGLLAVTLKFVAYYFVVLRLSPHRIPKLLVPLVAFSKRLLITY